MTNNDGSPSLLLALAFGGGEMLRRVKMTQ